MVRESRRQRLQTLTDPKVSKPLVGLQLPSYVPKVLIFQLYLADTPSGGVGVSGLRILR